MADQQSYDDPDPTQDHLATAARLLAGVAMDVGTSSRTEQAGVHALIDIAQSLRELVVLRAQETHLQVTDQK